MTRLSVRRRMQAENVEMRKALETIRAAANTSCRRYPSNSDAWLWSFERWAEGVALTALVHLSEVESGERPDPTLGERAP